jgi:predicted alpha/beta-fold hydrolase
VRFLDGVRIPTLLVCSKDDPMVPPESYGEKVLRRNPMIQQWVTNQGGHLGFLGRKPHRFWLDDAIIDWILAEKVRSRSAVEPR